MDEITNTAAAPIPSEPAAPTVVAAAPTGFRRHRLMLGLAGGTLVLGLAAGAGTAYALDGHSTTAPTTASGASVQGTSFFPPGYGYSGQGGSDSGSSGSTGQGYTDPGFGSFAQGGATSDQSAAVPASTSQTVGMVTIDTVLSYQGAQAAGTGMILTSKGLVLTNNHVVEGSTSIQVTDESTGQTYTAKVVGTDATHDVALLQLQDASGLTPITPDTTGTVSTGDDVTAIGNAQGTGSLVAASGTVVATDQSMTASDETGSNPETLSGLIEFSADVVGGDSGGALIDSQGEVVGMTTAASSSQSSAVTAYAIGIQDALKIAIDMYQGVDNADTVLGYPAFMGVSLSSDGSATLAGVVQGTPAEQAGLAAGDTITSVDGTAISSSSDLSSAIAAHKPGDKVTVQWTTADGTSASASITLIEGPAA